MKKILSFIIVITLSLCILPITATAQTYAGGCGMNLTYTLDTETGLLTISGSGDMTDFSKYSDAPWYSYRNSIKNIIIGDSVTSIGKNAFYDCVELSEISIGSDVITIGASAFYKCISLTEITIPADINAIGDAAFDVCYNLKTVNNYSSLYITEGSNDYGLVASYAEVVNWYGVITENCGENLTYTFNAVNGLLTVFGSGDMMQCQYPIDFPWNKYKEMVKKVIISDHVTNITPYAFFTFPSLTEVVLGNDVTSIGDFAFFDCANLAKVTLGRSVNEISYRAFDSCYNLKTIDNYSSIYYTVGSTMNGYLTYYAEVINWYGTPAGSCGENLTYTYDIATGTLTLSGSGSTFDYKYASYAPWGTYNKLIKRIILPPTLTHIGENVFGNCTNATEIVIPNGITHISSAAFADCPSLTEITIPDTVILIEDGAFYNCINLKTVNNYSKLPIIKGSNNYGYAGYYADTVNWLYEGEIGGNCNDGLNWSLNKESFVLTISGTGKMDNYDFYDNPAPWYDYRLSIKEAELSDGVTSIGNSAFYGCTAIKSITIPKNVTSIGDNAFYGCTDLRTVTNYSKLLIVKGHNNYGYVALYDDTVNNIAAPTLSTKDDTTITLNVVEGCEYSLDGKNWQNSATFTGLNPGTSYTFYQRLKIGGNKNAYSSKLDVTTDDSFIPGWNLIEGTWYYVSDSGEYVTGWLNLNNIWYYFNQNGEMQTGWQLINYHWYYFHDGGNMATGWLYVNGTYYYLSGNGAMLTGWLNQGGTWYYLTDSGAMATGWCLVGNSWYYFAGSGAMHTGWLNLGGTWYYFHSGGNMVTGWQLLGGTWYYFHDGGNMATGWQWLGNAWYNFAPSGAWLP